MDKITKKYCTEEKQISKEQILMDTYLLLRENYVAKLHNNGEYITIELLNGQVFKLKVFEGEKILPAQL